MMRRGKLAENVEDWKIGSMPKKYMTRPVFPLLLIYLLRFLQRGKSESEKDMTALFCQQTHRFAHFKRYYNYSI